MIKALKKVVTFILSKTINSLWYYVGLPTSVEIVNMPSVPFFKTVFENTYRDLFCSPMGYLVI